MIYSTGGIMDTTSSLHNNHYLNEFQFLYIVNYRSEGATNRRLLFHLSI
ncbi:hypothetical protein [Sporosarcina sp. P17b]|nr:hypothetical protein [Sporosarcina sp. P17b]